MHLAKSSLFRVVPIELYSKTGSLSTFAFIDDGSSVTLLDKSVAEFLCLNGENDALCLTWTSNITRAEPESKRVCVGISGIGSSRKYQINNARTVQKLDLPRQTLHYSSLSSSFAHLRGLPITDYDDAVPMILIGCDNAHLGAVLKIREGGVNAPIASKTRLGWTIHGPLSSDKATVKYNLHVDVCSSVEDDLHELVRQHFSVENVGVSLQQCPESVENERAMHILQSTTKRVGKHYETGIIWKYDYFEFPDSYAMGVRRLQCLERRMQADPIIGASVKSQILEYQKKGYIHRASEQELQEGDPRRTWYLPLGVVINPKKPGKIRIFCDAAAKVDGVSLNTMILKGPDLLVALPVVLFGFRERKVAICADVREMFHQIFIKKEDRHAQRLLWRDSPEEEPQIYFMDVATFGSSCSPCSAQYVKNVNATEFEEKYPAAAEAIKRKHYVDDYLDSVDSIDEAVQRATEVKYIHSCGGFEIRSWMSNNEEVLRRIGEASFLRQKSLCLEQRNETERVLGILWLPKEDAFTYSTISDEVPDWPTKREVLKVVMRLFDPLGFITHFIVHGKILIQDIWRSERSWDDKIPEKLRSRWKQWVDMFPLLADVRLTRCYFPSFGSYEISSLQIHVFTDASEAAFACSAYFRAEIAGKIYCTLVAAKSKVAPLKLLSIPRLELMAAVIGARLLDTIVTSHTLPIARKFLWTDSRTVLAWINSDQRKYRQFVAFRIGEIISRTNIGDWRWVPSRMNVADEATKWGCGPQFGPESRWYCGPEYLYGPEESWPKQPTGDLDSTQELRICKVYCHDVIKSVVEWNRYSQWDRLLRSVAYVRRYIQNFVETRKSMPRTAGQLTQSELSRAEAVILKQIQRECYPEEIEILTTARDSKLDARQTKRLLRLEKQSRLFRLSPLIDEHGVMRMESRIAQALFVPYDTRCPIILPRNHPVTRLIVAKYHTKYLHANDSTVLNELRQRFHVSNLRSLVRQVKQDCMYCRVYCARPVIPRMGPLPAARLGAFFRPFSFVGLDYFGPMKVRVNRSTVKRWIALFTCLSIRAVHLEIVHTLTTNSCKRAIRRFVVRRGAPVEIYSDNATNFVGASRELIEESNKINAQLSEIFTNAHTKWLFIPPSAPHMGGAWERLVRSVKNAFYAMSCTDNPDEETFSTLIVEAEGVVNSRPLTFITLESSSQEALTPNHFLLLNSNGVVQPPRDLLEPKAVRRTDWNLCREILDSFWRRWVLEYLPVITRRTKWFTECEPLVPGDLVVIVEENIRNGWTRGRVLEVIKAKDGRVRQAVVQTADRILRRPVAKLARLDVQAGNSGTLSDQGYGPGNVGLSTVDQL